MPDKVKKYIVVETDKPHRLQFSVGQKIGEGFQPLGGVCTGVNPIDSSHVYLQAMVKYA